MVSITKRPTARGIGNKETATPSALSFAALILLVLIGVHCLSWFIVVVMSTNRGGGGESFDNAVRKDHPRLRIVQEMKEKEKDLQCYLQKAKSILMQLDQLSNFSPLSSSSTSSSSHERLQIMNEPQLANRQGQQISNKGNSYNKLENMESHFLFTVRKECIPGRDDSNGEINPTTHRQRECLRHVPTIGQMKTNNNNHKSEEVDMNLPKPRIGLMFPPGYIGQAFARWIADALKRSSSSSSSASSFSSNHGINLDILSTSHVPVYGYGKSHGYTKIIRFVPLPLSLAVYDASLYGLSSTLPTSTGVVDISSLNDALERIKLGRTNDGSSLTIAGSILRLILRWHCRLSHVSAHTAMLTISLDDVLKDPTTALSNVLTFIWREDWEWEDRVSGSYPRSSPISSVGSRDWRKEAGDLVVNHGESLHTFLDITSLILNETISLANSNDNENALQQSTQNAFASEMDRSVGMTVWPCPSFWEGVEGESKPTVIGDVRDANSQIQVLRRIADYMVPNCNDEDPFVRCTINKDRCEVKRNVKCG